MGQMSAPCDKTYKPAPQRHLSATSGVKNLKQCRKVVDPTTTIALTRLDTISLDAADAGVASYSADADVEVDNDVLDFPTDVELNSSANITGTNVAHSRQVSTQS
ncbi:hypothetical protein ECG_01972 [Echinococcus granulosus]|nr:hypothetical protein ECG_01972 [Echinococcus granulosus]